MWLETAQSDVCVLPCINVYVHPHEYWNLVANLESDLIRQLAGWLWGLFKYRARGLGGVRTLRKTLHRKIKLKKKGHDYNTEKNEKRKRQRYNVEGKMKQSN